MARLLLEETACTQLKHELKEKGEENMKKQQGFTLIELLIVVAIIAIIAAIAVPNLLSARMAANETSAIGGLRAIGSAQVSYSIANNQLYADDLDDLVMTDFLDGRFATGGNINGYVLEGTTTQLPNPSATSTNLVAGFSAGAGMASYLAQPIKKDTTGRYCYGIGADMTIRYMNAETVTGTEGCDKYPSGISADGTPVGGKSGSAS